MGGAALETPFDTMTAPLGNRVAMGLSRLALALKTNASQAAQPLGLSPTQTQILALLRTQPGGYRPSQLAQTLALGAPAMSEALQPLLSRAFAVETPDPADRRAKRIAITDAGLAVLAQVTDWPEALLDTVADLSPEEQAIFYRVIVKMIRNLQRAGSVPIGRLCVTCTHFRPFVHRDADTPHHCTLVDAAFGDRHLRLDCPEQQPAPPDLAEATWQRFLAAPSSPLPV